MSEKPWEKYGGVTDQSGKPWEKYQGTKQPQESPNELIQGLMQAGDLAASYIKGRSFGLAPKAAAAVGAGVAKPILEAGELAGIVRKGSTPSFADMYRQGVEMYSAPAERASKDNPALALIAELGGGLKTGIDLSKTGMAKNVADWAGKGSKLGSVAKKSLAGALGGEAAYRAYNVGTAPVGEEMDKLTSGAPVGAIVGGAFPVVAPVAKSLVNAVKSPIQSTANVLGGISKITDWTAEKISKSVARAGISEDLKGLKDAEILFLKTLKEEGVSVDDAVNALKKSKELGVSPSIGVSANIPQMQTQGYLISRGSSGSSVASKAIQKIDEEQIPLLNKKIISESTGDNLPAEVYGKKVAEEAKKLVENKKAILKNRASPFYQRSVGIDKSIDIENPMMRKALQNPLAVKALEDARTDPVTMTNVIKELGDLGIDASQIDKLPYNSTISLHAARKQLRRIAEQNMGQKEAYAAVKSAINDIDNAIESQFPDYKIARKFYSEDAGALASLIKSPVGKMASFAEGDYSKIANDIMSKDPQYIRKFVSSFGENEKIKDSIAGAFLKRKLEESSNMGRRFSDSVFRSEGSSERLKALIGEEKYEKIKKIDTIIDELTKTRNIPSQSITAAAQSLKDEITFPSDKVGLIEMVRRKITLSLLDVVQKNPEQAKKYAELLFTDDGYKFLESISKGKKATFSDIEKSGAFLNKIGNKPK